MYIETMFYKVTFYVFFFHPFYMNSIVKFVCALCVFDFFFLLLEFPL